MCNTYGMTNSNGLAKGLKGNRDAAELRDGDIISVAGRTGNMERAVVGGATLQDDGRVLITYRTVRLGRGGNMIVPATDRFTVVSA